MLIEKLFVDMIAARKGNDPVAKSLLVTLYSEANMVGKNRRNGTTTDDEVVSTVKKFAANVEETITNMEEIHRDTTVQRRELQILQEYLPEPLTEAQLRQAVRGIVEDLGVSGARAMGQVMSELKTRHGASYDGRLASTLVKEELS